MTARPHPHRGGCLFCRHWHQPRRCAHPAYAPLRPLWSEARDDETRCGTRGRLWEPCGGARV
ncbi:hypothetical protein [Thiocystis violascens]|uniref:hypothetical protein n=1 Tax=Thiocystis violascens TaxID=73141 RepID=UPI0012F68314|nr:hypothetical protein [Thiocystis violascens]